MSKLLCFCLLLQAVRSIFAETATGPRYFHSPMHEIMQTALYLKTSPFEEIVVAYSEKGSDIKEGDYLTHADGVRILNGGLQAFLKSGDKEAIVPVIEENDVQHGGSKFMGFVLMQVVQPRKLSTRRGEIVFDLEEGGPPPSMNLGNIVVTSSGAKTTSDPSYTPPPHGTGACITGKDCFYFNGTCNSGQCSCIGAYTGTYCQLNRPDMAAAAIMKKRSATLQQKQQAQRQEQQSTRPRAVNSDEEDKSKTSTSGSAFDSLRSGNSGSFGSRNEDNKFDETSTSESSPEEGRQNDGGGEKKKKRKKKASPKASPDADSENKPSRSDSSTDSGIDQASARNNNPSDASGDQLRRGHEATKGGSSTPDPAVVVLGDQSIDQMHFANVRSAEDLYGDQKKFPLPNLAGRLPNAVLNDRHRLRNSRQRFVYAVRYRTGPFGLVFDNRPNNMTVVETVVKGQQSDMSDIRAGDKLIAIDTFDVSNAPARIAQRILSSLSWPIILAFETQLDGNDPKSQQIQQRKRSFNMTVLFPPSFVGEYTIRLADWAKPLNLPLPNQEQRSSFCPVYRMRAPVDLFGCEQVFNDGSTEEEYYGWTAQEKALMESRGFVDNVAETEAISRMTQARSASYRFISLMLQESFVKKTTLEFRSAGIAKRGVCTFVDKGRAISNQGAQLALVVNSDNELIDAPAGKSDKPSEVISPFGLLRSDDGTFLNLAAKSNDIFFLLKPFHDDDAQEADMQRVMTACESVVQVAEDIVDRWPHTVPDLSISEILKIKPPDQSKVRGLTEEGGRVALSGENGWAFFDYHLAMFGPQEVPLGPNKFVLAQPAYGCDPNAYTVRVANATVGILRGGGCSFGIKVINAQKLGAKAVMIINTDDAKTMRLMALPDEVPLIKIPCVMVSRRIQFYVESQLKKYFPADHLLVSLQPTGVFGDYEKKNTLELPKRFDNGR